MTLDLDDAAPLGRTSPVLTSNVRNFVASAVTPATLTVVATTLPTAERKKNALRRKASATLSVRLAPEQTADGTKTTVITLDFWSDATETNLLDSQTVTLAAQYIDSGT